MLTTDQHDENHSAREHASTLRSFIANYQALFDAIDVGIIIIEDSGSFADVNGRACRLLKGSRERLVGSHFTEFVPTDSLEHAKQAFADLKSSGSFEGYFPFRALDGSLVELQWTARANLIPGLHLCVARDPTIEQLTFLQEEANLRLAAIVESSDDAIIGKTLDGTITSWNKGAEKIYGYAASEVVGRPISILVPAERADEIPQILQQLRQGEHVDHFETQRITKEGKRLFISLTISPIRDRAGRLSGASTIARDITATKLAQAQVQESRRQMEIIFQGVAESITVLDQQGKLVFANEAAARALGYEKVSDLLAAPVASLIEDYDLLDQSGAELVRDDLPGRVALKEGRPAAMTACFRHKVTGEQRWLSIKATPILNDQGQVQLAVNVFQDITDRKRSEENQRFLAETSQVLSSSLDYQTTLASVARMVVPRIADWCTVDILEDGVINRLAVAHVDPEKVAWAQQLHDLYPPDKEEEHGIPKVLRSGRSEIYPIITDEMLVAAIKDEKHLMILREVGFSSAMIVPLVTNDKILGALSFVAAESKRHFGPADLELAENLCRRAAQAIEHSRLYRLAHEANRLKDEFLATVSHELRTPLTAISGYAHMLRTGKLNDAETSHALGVIERSVQAQSRLINDILDVSRVITGKLQLNIQKIAPVHAINAAIDSIRPAAESKDIRLETKLDPSAGPIMGDPNRLQQIAWNLVSNAIKFTPAGGRVEARLENLDGHIQLEVNDTGIGIEPDFLPHVFERFRQADSSITRRYSGLGLGLAIARHLVELHGGTIEARSPGLGLGSSFIVRIPHIPPGVFAPVTLPAIDLEDEPSSEKDSETHPVLEGLRILVVDDNIETCQFLNALFFHCLAEVKTACSPDTAIEVLKDWSPDILLCDIGMPGEDGYSLLDRIRDLNTTGGQLPAIALTGYARPEDRQRALAAGFNLHMTKPIEPVKLMLSVARLTGRGQSA